MKLLREIYKTYEGARKRAGFENGIAPSEYARGDKAHLYRYRVIAEGSKPNPIHYRVQRYTEGTNR